MQVTETLSEGLKRELQVVIPASDLETKVMAKLEDAKSRVQIKGFRPGRVPIDHLKKMYGKSIMAEVIEETVSQTTQSVVDQRDEKPAFRPDIRLPEDKVEVERVLAGLADLSFGVAFEVLPPFELTDFGGIEIERLVADVSDADVDEAVQRIADQNKPFVDRPNDAAAETGDRVTIDFTGRIDGEAFEGGSASDAPLEIGSGQFIPGFEEQLIGVKAGDETVINVTFPLDYGAESLAGKDAEFEVVVKGVAVPGNVTLDDAFAATLGMDSLDNLKAAVRQQIETDLGSTTRMKVKRQLLDKLDELHSFDLPPTLVEREFDGIWTEVKADMERAGKTFADEDTTREKAESDYRAIAERRVRLGLVLAKAGENAEVDVSDDEMQRALFARARQFPGQEQQVIEHYQKNPGMQMELRAPIYEDKVVDYILELAAVTDRTVSREELLKDGDDGGDADHSGG